MKISGCIFDMDGLMFDTERLCLQAMTVLGAEMGRDFLTELPDMCGISAREEETVYKNRYGIDFDYKTYRRRRTQWITDYILEKGIPVKPGLYELLDFLHGEGIPMAIASSSTEKIIRRNLAMTGTDTYFKAVICGDMVEKSKPDPQIFLAATKALGTVPSETVVFEDSFFGIQAAAAGGFLPCMVPDLRQPNEDIQKMLAARFDTLADAIPFVRKGIGPDLIKTDK